MHKPTKAAQTVRAMNLIQALRRGDLELAQSLLQEPLDVNFSDPRGVTPLMVAAYRGYSSVCDRLMQLGADPLKYRDRSAEDALDHGRFESVGDRAVMSRDSETVYVVESACLWARWKRIVREPRHDQRAIVSLGAELLPAAAALGANDLVAHMVMKGVPADGDPDADEVPILAAAKAGHYTTCVILGLLGADLDGPFASTDLSEDLLECIRRARSLCTRETRIQDSVNRVMERYSDG